MEVWFDKAMLNKKHEIGYAYKDSGFYRSVR